MYLQDQRSMSTWGKLELIFLVLNHIHVHIGKIQTYIPFGVG